jgi:hypothetical protein
VLGNRWHAGASFGVFGSDLTFGKAASDVFIERRAISASLDYRLSAANTLSFGGGAGLGGRMVINNDQYEITPGWLVTASYSRRLLEGRGAAPFILAGVSAGGSGASTRQMVSGRARDSSSVSLYAFDIRIGLTVGKTFWNVLSPYAAVRAFGGPVLWKLDGKSQAGTDQRHFQVAVGMVCSLPRGFDLFAEVAPGGERAVSIGGGVGF